mgnify:FL=1|jgi:hypothetical protein
MKKIFLIAMMACAVFGTMTSCSEDYEDASKPHVYSETENPPVKGSDANMVTASMKMKQAEAGTEVKIVDLSVYSDKVQEQLGMSLDEAIAGLGNGTVRFLPVNPARRVWDKTAANAGDNKWYLTSAGTVASSEDAAATMEFLPTSKEVKITLTQNATTGIIPVTFGFVKTDNSAYPVNFRCQALVTVTDASVCDVALTVPKGNYAAAQFKFETIAKNIEYALGITDLKELAAGLDTESPVYNVYLMDAKGNLNGGPGKYTANGAGYWMTSDLAITTWGTNHALFMEPFIYDEEAKDFYADGGGFNCGRLSSDTPASGTVLTPSIVIKPVKDTGKTLTINFTLTFE